jgi:hypothetical protein
LARQDRFFSRFDNGQYGLRLRIVMKARISGMLLLLTHVGQADLCPGSAGAPELLTPGSANCSSSTTATGTRTTFTVFDDTILRWPWLELRGGDELVFDFDGGHAVANLLGPGKTHRIDGDVSANGKIGFFSEGRGFEVNGKIKASEVTLSTSPLTKVADFLSGGAYQMLAGSGFQTMSIKGQVEATNGDVVVAGDFVRVSGEAQLRASGAVRIGAGQEINVGSTGDSHLETSGGLGILLHLGDSRASLLELVATHEISNAGRIDALGGFDKVFLEVGEGGSILNEGTGVILGQTMITGNFDSKGVILGLDEGDTLAVVNSSVINIPALKDPSGRQVSNARKIETNAAMTGSADALRKTVKKPPTVVRTERKSLLRRQSFFGMRGGQKPKR